MRKKVRKKGSVSENELKRGPMWPHIPVTNFIECPLVFRLLFCFIRVDFDREHVSLFYNIVVLVMRDLKYCCSDCTFLLIILLHMCRILKFPWKTYQFYPS